MALTKIRDYNLHNRFLGQIGFFVRRSGHQRKVFGAGIKPCAQPQYANPNPSQIHRSVPFAYPAYK